MSTTNIDIFIRTGLWNAYEQRCFFCKRPLEWDGLEVDHIIPEVLARDPGNLQRIIKEYELEKTFAINDLYNLVPAHAHCNSSKSGTLFDKTTVLFYHGITKRNLSEVQIQITKLRNKRQKGQTISKLHTSLAAGLITPQELDQISQSIKEEQWATKEIKITSPIDFIDEVYDTFYLNGNYSSLYDKKLLVNGVSDSLTLSADTGKQIEVSTLREWQFARKEGYKTRDNSSFKMAFVFEDLENFLSAINNAKMPKLSFVSEPWVDLNNPRILSPKILTDFENTLLPHILAGKSIADLAIEKIVTITGSNPSGITLLYEGFETRISEQFRADFNNDGIEDIFIQGWTRSVEGTLGFGFSKYISRFSINGLLEYL